jgi:hypothetical protein
MKVEIRILLIILLGLIAILHVNLFLFPRIKWIYEIKAVEYALSIALMMAVGFFVWKKTNDLNPVQARYIITGGFAGGAIGFFLGSILACSLNTGNLCGLVGFFFTGPLGVILGLVAGNLIWRRKRSVH